MERKDYEKMTTEELIAALKEKDELIRDLKEQLDEHKVGKERRRLLQAEGIRVAKDKGVRFGRPKKKIPKEFYRYRQAYYEGLLTLQEAADKSHCSVTTFRKWDKETRESGDTDSRETETE